LITGGTGGIGTAICKQLVDQGCKVVAGYLPSLSEQATEWQAEHKAAGYAFEIAPGDVADFESAAGLVRDIESRTGPIDVLINCAGITRDKTLRKMELEHWRAVLSTNLDSAFNVTKHVVDGMTERGWGRIVNISSINGQKGQFGQTNYSAAKAGLHGFTMALAQEVARKGVTVNTVSPGYVATPMAMAIAEDIRNAIVAQIPMGRMGDPAEIAFAVGMLCDERASFITGANIAVNGGMYMT
jgi:acetoacetyl-CoA reductase